MIKAFICDQDKNFGVMLHSLPRVLIKFTSNALPNIHDLTPLNYSFNFTEKCLLSEKCPTKENEQKILNHDK